MRTGQGLEEREKMSEQERKEILLEGDVAGPCLGAPGCLNCRWSRIMYNIFKRPSAVHNIKLSFLVTIQKSPCISFCRLGIS